MERGFDGECRRRFDAHELYLLSVLFDVPIARWSPARIPSIRLDRRMVVPRRALEDVFSRLAEVG